MSDSIRWTPKASTKIIEYSGEISKNNSQSFKIKKNEYKSPLGSIICNFSNDYNVDFNPDGSSNSYYKGCRITHPDNKSKAIYIKDNDTNEVWSLNTASKCGKQTQSTVEYTPGKAKLNNITNKIESTLEIICADHNPCEIMRITIKNLSAKERNISITSYIKPDVNPVMEAVMIDEKSMLMRMPLGSSWAQKEKALGDIILFQTSTINPTRCQIKEDGFFGEDASISKPNHILDNDSFCNEGITSMPIISMTYDIVIPIEGEAQIGICFGIAESEESAMRIVSNHNTLENIETQINDTDSSWKDITSTLKIKTNDPYFDALINTWLPYESYCGWIDKRCKKELLNPYNSAGNLRRYYPIAGSLSEYLLESIIDFTHRLTMSGAFSPDDESFVIIPPEELLWLVISTCAYVSETDDYSALNIKTPLKDGIEMTIKEHCERILLKCKNVYDLESINPYILETAFQEWIYISRDESEINKDILDTYKKKMIKKEAYSPEKRSLPRKNQYIHSLTQSLSEKTSREIIDNAINYCDENNEGCIDTILYKVLAEKMIGIKATANGLMINPNLPENINYVNVHRRYRNDTYKIYITKKDTLKKGQVVILADGIPILGTMLPYSGDCMEHNIDIICG
ncbi:MAG: hypothetical protein SNJ70_01030 [Armatimonadota bacterium]